MGPSKGPNLRDELRQRSSPPLTRGVTLVDVIRRVLIVDDDQGLRTVLAAALGDEGFTVTQAGDGLAGLRQFEATAPT